METLLLPYVIDIDTPCHHDDQKYVNHLLASIYFQGCGWAKRVNQIKIRLPYSHGRHIF